MNQDSLRTAIWGNAQSLHNISATSMNKTYVQIQKQIEALQREADKVKRQEVDEVIARMKEAIRVYQLTAADLGLESRGPVRRGMTMKKRGRPAGNGRANGASTVKYRDESGNVWGGRGPRPQWLREALGAGKSLQDFAV